jgi:hypothetical protein
MLPFRVASVVVCDDIRVEQNNKFILIGVYTGNIVVGGFPAEIGLCWWIQFFVEELGRFDLEIQLVKDDGATLLRLGAGLELTEREWGVMSTPKLPLQIQRDGSFKLQMKKKDDSDWATINQFSVKIGNVPDGVAQVVM